MFGEEAIDGDLHPASNGNSSCQCRAASRSAAQVNSWSPAPSTTTDVKIGIVSLDAALGAISKEAL
jgi:hypothetical protein